MSFEAPLGLSTSNHLYAITIKEWYMRTPRKGEYTRFESGAYYHLIISGGFMLTSLFCNHFAHNFIRNRLMFDNRCENDISITDG